MLTITHNFLVYQLKNSHFSRFQGFFSLGLTEGLDGGVLNSLFNKNININSVFSKYKVNTIKYDISKYLFDKM